MFNTVVENTILTAKPTILKPARRIQIHGTYFTHMNRQWLCTMILMVICTFFLIYRGLMEMASVSVREN